MGRHWCSIRNKLSPRATGLRRATTSSASKTFKNNRAQNRPTCKRSCNANLIFLRNPGIRRRRERRSQAVGVTCAEQGRETETAFARARERDRPAPRLFSAVAKKSAGLEARARRRLDQGPHPRDGGFGFKSKLRGVRTRRVGRKNGGQCSGDRLRSEPRVARTE